MSLNGIWKFEILGVYDWEPVSTAFMQDGRYWAGSADHYTVGSYEVVDGGISAEVTAVMHGRATTLFGKTSSRFQMRFKGEASNGEIKGTASDAEGKFVVQFRATRLADLP